MLNRKLQLLISTKCTAVPHGSYCRALRVLHPSEYKIVALRLSYINCLFILAFKIFSNTSFYLVLSSVCLRTSAMNRTIRLRNVRCYCLCTINVYSTNIRYLSSYTNVYPRAPTVGSRFIVPAYHGIHATDCPRTPILSSYT